MRVEQKILQKQKNLHIKPNPSLKIKKCELHNRTLWLKGSEAHSKLKGQRNARQGKRLALCGLRYDIETYIEYLSIVLRIVLAINYNIKTQSTLTPNDTFEPSLLESSLQWRFLQNFKSHMSNVTSIYFWKSICCSSRQNVAWIF